MGSTYTQYGYNTIPNMGGQTSIQSNISTSTSTAETEAEAEADTEFEGNGSSCSTDKKDVSKKYKSLEELSDDILREVLEGFELYQESNGTKGLSYKVIAKKYEIKQEYLDKNLGKRIKTILTNREAANRMVDDSYPSYDDDYFDDDSFECLSDYLDRKQAKEILDTFDSLSDDSRARYHYQNTFPKDYGIPETVMSNYFGYVDLLNELQRIAALKHTD